MKKRRQQFGAAGGSILWAGHQAELPDNRINFRHFAADESLLLSSLLAPAEEGVGPCWKLLGDEPGLKGPGRPIPHRRITLWRLCIPHLNPPRHDGDTVGGDSFIAKLTKCYDVNIFFFNRGGNKTATTNKMQQKQQKQSKISRQKKLLKSLLERKSVVIVSQKTTLLRSSLILNQ